MAAGRRPKANVMSQPEERQIIDTSSPEFKTAVDAQAQAIADAAIAKLTTSLAGLPVAGGAPAEIDAKTLFSQMALAIAEISDQGTNRKRVAPEILAQRAKSHSLMIDAILAAKRDTERNRAERPKYRAIGKMYLNERFIEPFTLDPATKKPVPVEIYWSGVPNEVMRPLNDVAEEIYRHFRDSIGSVEKVVAQQATWISAGGLVIIGEAPERRMVSGYDAPLPQFDDDFGFADAGQNDPTKPFVNVLGTVQPAARQNYDQRAN